MNMKTILVAALWVTLLGCFTSSIHAQGGGNSPPVPLPEIKATSINSVLPPIPPPPLPQTGLTAAPYNWTPTTGSVDNLISVWPGIQLTLYISFPPGSVTPPASEIFWTSAGFTIPDGTQSYQFSWTNTGVQTVHIQVGTATYEVRIDVPNVGNVTQASAASGINPFVAGIILGYAQTAEIWASGQNVAGFPENKVNALRHAFWNGLCASDDYTSSNLNDVTAVTRAHEYNNKWAERTNIFGNPVSPQEAYDTTIDLHNNSIGITVSIKLADGSPNRNAIWNNLLNQYTQGNLYIWDGLGPQANSQGIVLKSDGTKIY